jgi:hypothetical protein
MPGPSADEVRRQAFRSAAAAVDRFLERVGEPVADRFTDLGAATFDRFQAELARVVDLNLEMVRNAFGVYGSLLDPSRLQGDGGKVTYSPGVPGSESVAVVWLHNFDAEPMTDVTLVGSRLSSREGIHIDDPVWSFQPSPVTVLAQSAVPVLSRLAIPADAETGSYAGSVSVAGRMGEPVEVRVDVIAMDPIGHDSW